MLQILKSVSFHFFIVNIKNVPRRQNFVTDYKEKAEPFNVFCAKECSLIKNNSKLLSHLHYLTDNCLSSVGFSQDDITKTIQNLDPNRAQGHDKISIHMLKDMWFFYSKSSRNYI